MRTWVINLAWTKDVRKYVAPGKLTNCKMRINNMVAMQTVGLCVTT
jgi:hypothetical protein